MVHKYSSVSSFCRSQRCLPAFVQQFVFCSQSHLFNFLLPPLSPPPWSLFTFEIACCCSSVCLSSSSAGSNSSGGSYSFKILANKNLRLLAARLVQSSYLCIYIFLFFFPNSYCNVKNLQGFISPLAGSRNLCKFVHSNLVINIFQS